jgi:lipoprotein-anchoring transpeptidase ErfK/SrfK
MAIDTIGDGIHGTDEPWSIGSAASHGCIRMLVPDVIQLYGMTPLGTPVWVV